MGCEKISDSSVWIVINLSIFIDRMLVLEWISNEFQISDTMFDGEIVWFQFIYCFNGLYRYFLVDNIMLAYL